MLRDMPSHNLYTVLMVISLLAVAIAKGMAPLRFNEFISVIGNSKYLKIYSKAQKFFDVYDGLLFLNLIISLAVFYFLAIKTFTGISVFNLASTLKLVLIIGVFILAKVLLERLIASLFEIDTMIDYYLFQKICYKNYFGLFLLPINTILIFSITPTKTIIYSVLTLLFIVNISGLTTTFKVYQNEIKHNLFYFILYLCALEIAPFIIVGSFLVPN
ncbi:DUF4271 domain-containing protein [Flavobacteriaceae bacterium MHTCC 0001]